MSGNKFVNAITITLLLFFMSCKNQQSISNDVKTNTDKQENVYKSAVKALAPVIIYKTKVDYNKNVPVIMSEDKKDIISYPDIKDVYYNGQLAFPTRLERGYLLDNRGISKNTAFLKYTYEEYSRLSETPSKDILKSMILDINPLLEIYSCNSISKSNIEELNKYINQGLPGICKDLLK